MPGVPGGAPDNFGGVPAAGNSGLELLRAARKALAVGDVRRAQTLVQQARSQQAQFDPVGDTPERVEALIRRHQDVMAMPNNTEGYRRAYAKLLVEQAYGLLRSGDLAEAEELANQAARQGVTYSPFEQTPQDLLRQIAAARRQLGPAAYAAAPHSQFASQESDGALRRPVGEEGPQAPNMPIGSVTPELRQEALELVRKSREALAAGQYQWAEDLAKRAARMRLPDEVFGPPENQPGQLLYEIRLARSRQSQVLPASASYPVTHAGGEGPADQSAQRAFYQPHTDGTRNVRAGHEVAVRPDGYYHLAQVPTPAPPRQDAGSEPRPPAQPRETVGMSLFRQGEEALRAHDKDRAYQFFRQAANYMHELDAESQQRLRERLTLLAPPAARPAEQPGRPATEEAAMALSAQARQAYQDVLAQESKAKALRATDPKGAMKLLEDTRTRIEGAGLDTATRNRLLVHLDRAIAETKQFIEHNRPHIELEDRNRQIRDEIEREQRLKVEIEAKYALLVNEFNRLMDEQRFEEAEVVAKRAAELDPQNPVSQQLLWQSKFVRRFMNNEAVKAAKEDMFVRALGRVEEAAVAFDDMRPYQHGDVRQWEELTRSRARFAARRGRPRSEREMEIERKLRTPVSLQFQNASLGRVLDYLAKVADVNLYLDPQGLAQEGVTTDTPVTIDLRQEITLKSALNLILEPLHLKYTIKNEVLKITSEQMRDSDLYRVTYNVADLVVPIPHFVPSPRMGLAGAVHDALGNFGYGGGAGGFGSLNTPLAVVASKDGSKGSAAINPAVLAQVAGPSMASGAIPTHTGPIGFGPGGLGGGAQADFDSLIDLITTTVRPDTWDAGGGAGTIAPFETNLSIVVSQTQEVHEEIVDLLEQLRRLQDLQVTIEVRFITLNDNFFERIGIDFDFNVDDNIDGKPGQPFGRIVGPPPAIGQPPIRDFQNVDHGKNVTVGLSPQLTTGMNPDLPSVFAADLDIPFRQNSFGLAVPQFGGYQAAAGATLGFAILSDIEAFFFIEAAQGDRRTNVLQAPKVTLFNGQQAFVSDTSQTPFVISVIPVVGDFAAAQQPVIVVSVAYPGAAPEVVEREVLDPLEEAISGISGVDQIRGIAYEGFAQIIVLFSYEKNLQEASSDLRDRISVIRGQLPPEMEEPVLSRVDPQDLPILSLALFSPRRGPAELTALADPAILKELRSVPGVAQANLVGGVQPEMRVELRPEALRAAGISLAEVVQALQLQNLAAPVGSLEDGRTTRAIRLQGRLQTPDEFAQVVVARRGNRLVRLGDVATVWLAPEEPTSLARYNGRPTVGIDLVKAKGYSTTQVVDEVLRRVDALRARLPADVRLDVIQNSGERVRRSVGNVQRSLFEGALLTVVVVFFFLASWRSTVITGLALPISVISAFTAVWAFGFTLNVMSLLGLSLAIGLLIDDAIVVRENIVRHVEMGKDHYTAAREGTAEIGLAVAATTFSIVATFVPIAFIGGVAGQWFKPFALTIAAAVLVSLVVSFSLDPMLSAYWPDPQLHRRSSRHPLMRLAYAFNRRFDRAAERYQGIVAWALDHRGATFAIAIGSLVLALVLHLAFGGTEFVPRSDRSEFRVLVETPPGTALAATEHQAERAAAALRRFREVAYTYTTVGGAGGIFSGVGSTQASIYVRLVPKHERSLSQRAVADSARAVLQRLGGAKYAVFASGFGATTNRSRSSFAGRRSAR